MMVPLLSLLGAIGATAAAQVAYKKYSVEHGRCSLYATVLLFAAAPPLTYLAVKGFGVGTVYISTGVTYILVAAAGWRLFGETPSRRRLVAMAFVLTGIVVYGIGL
jgi:multidrug transporter EmrE-like cation transporter